LLEPGRGVAPKLFKKTFPLRFAGRDAAYNRLRGVGDPAAFHFCFQNIAAADAELLPNSLGNDHLIFIFYSDDGQDVLNSSTVILTLTNSEGLSRVGGNWSTPKTRDW
jgi:hypothetical protein